MTDCCEDWELVMDFTNRR